MVSFLYSSVTQATGVELYWEVGVSWNCEAGDGFGKLFVAMYGSSFEGRVGVGEDSR